MLCCIPHLFLVLLLSTSCRTPEFVMPPKATSTAVLIIVLILNTLSAPPPPQPWAPVANTQEIAYQIDDLSSDYDPFAGHPSSWLPPMDIHSGHFSIANTTEPSDLLLLLVCLTSRHDQQALHCGRNNTTVNNRTAPWISLPLEPGIYGAPRARDEPVCSNPLGLNFLSGPLTLRNSRLMPTPPMVESKDQRIFADYFSEIDYSFKESITAAQPRKLLLDATADGTNLHGHRKVLVHKKHAVTKAWVAFGLALLSALCFAAGFIFWCTRSSLDNERPNQPADICPCGPRRYSHRELAAATSGFSDEKKIGRGGFGPVYRGYLRDQGCDAAIKVLRGSSVHEQGRREFQAEVKVMTRLRHRNIVQLLGWCDGQGGLMLVYEFVPNGSLDKHLHHPQRLLAWPDRYKIALGVGSAILYLHTECDHLVLHGDNKPANILLDDSCNAKLGDFGLARLVDHGSDSTSPTTQVVAGTPGYMDPEFVTNQRPCPESDVFSFGVVLLEIACGRRPTTAQPTGTPVLLNWVRDMYSKNSLLGVADRRLDGEYDGWQMRRVLVVGLWCTHHDQSERPSIAQAMDLLRREDAELPLLDLVTHGPDAVRSLEEIAYGDLSQEDSASEGSSTDTAYHTSTDSTCLLGE
ncbi:hypothetical protein HU200_064398 [Digitaria exilis]|uniref:Protein kinase domain-containing protein n=1 Tax=Digitaria exilis TaxID=1010633 RepID=A0A835A5S1_9POAL|nr:hypothetical protein HU200_064398 [Digitaria exilis]